MKDEIVSSFILPPSSFWTPPVPVTAADIVAARSRIAGGVAVTPCPESVQLSELCGARIYCKLEYLQRTGSFKERGARNALLLLDDEARRRASSPHRRAIMLWDWRITDSCWESA